MAIFLGKFWIRDSRALSTRRRLDDLSSCKPFTAPNCYVASRTGTLNSVARDAEVILEFTASRNILPLLDAANIYYTFVHSYVALSRPKFWSCEQNLSSRATRIRAPFVAENERNEPQRCAFSPSLSRESDLSPTRFYSRFIEKEALRSVQSISLSCIRMARALLAYVLLMRPGSIHGSIILFLSRPWRKAKSSNAFSERSLQMVSRRELVDASGCEYIRLCKLDVVDTKCPLADSSKRVERASWSKWRYRSVANAFTATEMYRN